MPTVGCEAEKMLAPARPDHGAQNNTTHGYGLGSLVQWVSVLPVYLTALWVWRFNLKLTDDWNTGLGSVDS